MPITGTEKLRFDWTNSLGVARTVLFFYVEAFTQDLTTTITRYPRERGTDAADHARNEPEGLTFTVFVSNSPIDHPDGQWRTLPLNLPPRPVQPGSLSLSGQALGFASSLINPQKPLPETTQVWTPPQGRDLVREALADLNEMRDTNAIVQVAYTATGPFVGEYAVTKITPNQTNEEGDGMTITIELQRVLFADVAIVPAPAPTAIKAKAATNSGTQSLKEITITPSKSIARSLRDTGREALRPKTGVG